MQVEGEVNLQTAGRNESLQRRIGNEGEATDVGFHLIADIFNGPTNRLNVVPGNGQPIAGDASPNLNNGAYKQFENAVRAAREAGHDVEVRIRLEYDPNNLTDRADQFRVSYRIDGIEFSTDGFPINRNPKRVIYGEK